MEIIVENEITGVSEWRYNLTDRLTEAALSALRAATPGDGLGEETWNASNDAAMEAVAAVIPAAMLSGEPVVYRSAVFSALMGQRRLAAIEQGERT